MANRRDSVFKTAQHALQKYFESQGAKVTPQYDGVRIELPCTDSTRLSIYEIKVDLSYSGAKSS